MADVATLGLRIDGTQIVAADQALERFTQTSQRAERATSAYTGAQRLSSSEIQRATQEYDRAFRSMGEMHSEANRMNQAIDRMATGSQRSTAGLGRLNFTLASVARQATGTHPAIAQVANVVGGFAVGTAVMTGVLAGLAATAVAIRLIGREAREAEERLKGARDVLDRLAGADPVGGAMATVQGRYNQTVAELTRLRGMALTGDPMQDDPIIRRREKLFEEAMADAARLAAGGGALEDTRLADAIARSRTFGPFRPRDLSGDIAADQRALGRQLQGQDYGDLATGRSRYTGLFIGGASETVRKAMEEEALLREEALRAEEELFDARERANDALIQGLYNVGRAYGGVTDQVLALTAATIDIYRSGRLPTASGGDRATAYGTAALSGIGIGASTGSPLLGAAGGAASGFGIAGPAGAIVGAVGGIVSGLFESGQRAEEARRIWRRALEDFSAMFEDLSPQEQALRDVQRFYEELRAGLLAQVNVGQNAIQLAKDYERELAKLDETYRKQIEAANELEDAERALYDARFTALNAPQGFNLAYAGYVAGGGFSAGGSNRPSGNDLGTLGEPVIVQVVLDGEVISEKLEKRQKKKKFLGGTFIETSR
jgi:hypothetical protein